MGYYLVPVRRDHLPHTGHHGTPAGHYQLMDGSQFVGTPRIAAHHGLTRSHHGTFRPVHAWTDLREAYHVIMYSRRPHYDLHQRGT